MNLQPCLPAQHSTSNMSDGDGFDEDELQAALALSMQQQSDGDVNNNLKPLFNWIEKTCPQEIDFKPDSNVTLGTINDNGFRLSSANPVFTVESRALESICEFRKLMFNDSITTTNDKERWIYECIATAGKFEPSQDYIGPFKSQIDFLTGYGNMSPLESIINADKKPAAVGNSMHHLWGLTQTHGGPCGVLAAIQAEIIRILLFGRDVANGDLHFPFHASTSTSDNFTKRPYSANQVREALAMAIGMILARAAVMPPALISEKQPAKRDVCVKLVVPDKDAKEHQDENSEEKSDQEKSDQFTDPWVSEMLGANTTKCRLGLTVHSIQLQEDENDSSPELKRRKGVTFASLTTVNEEKSQEQKLHENQMGALAQSVANYLLGKSDSDGDEKKNPSIIPPLDYFCGPGGIMFFVMSLVESRGIDVIKNDMDDPTTTITSQFGHSSQELINLLLTGQAVSNVFDNTVTLGDLRCRGIQQRPAIGYLSQLESLNYCEVGGYMKLPVFPIWVIGSTSHFTVMFGAAECLNESQSDLLLERCRRAFKKAEDGGESGFILVQKFGLVVDELSLREKLGGDNGVQTLQAFLEVSGAGIILWEDCWKSLSRLLTGSSLESIIDSSDEVIHVATIPPAMQSDEELAKKLAEEWGSSHETDNPEADSDEAYARRLQAQWDAEADAIDDNKTNDATMDDTKSDDDSLGLGFNPSDFELSNENPDVGSGMKEHLKNRPPTPPNSSVRDSILDTVMGNFEEYGSSFEMFHYNGLRGGTLTPFRVTRLSATEAVGSSIGLSSGTSNHGSDDLEAVVRTKWPSCTFDWLGDSKRAPCID